MLEDCAQAVQGSIDDNLKIGRLGAAAVYSFNGSKAIPAGEGGMIATNDDDLAKYFFNFTMSVTSPREVVIRRFNDASQGWNYRLSALAASLSESLIHSLPKRIKTARNSCVTIQSLLANRPWLRAIGGQNRPDFAPLGCPTLLCRQATGLSLAESRAVLYFALRFAGFPVSVWVPDSIPDTKLLKNYGNTLITTSKHFANAKSVADGHIIFPTGAGAITGFRNKSRLDRVFDAFERLLG